MPVVKDDGTLVLALVRGDDRLERRRSSSTALGADFRPATDEEIRSAFGADAGSLGPVGFDGEIVADEALREGQFVAGANRDGLAPARRRGGPRLPAALRRHPRAEGGRRVPELRRRARLPDRDRGRPHLQARHPLLGAARRDVPRRGRHARSRCIMGSYGIGPGPRDGRRGRAAPRRGRDRAGRRRSRRTTSHVVALAAAPRRCCECGGGGARARGGRRDVLLDDREQRPGEKFADADLIGVPMRVIVGKKTLEDGAVDVRERASGDEERVARLELAKLGSGEARWHEATEVQRGAVRRRRSSG